MSGMAEAEALSLRRDGQEVGTEQLLQLKVSPILAEPGRMTVLSKQLPKSSQ